MNKHPADQSDVRQAVRKVLQHHKLTKYGDGVVEADIAHAVYDALQNQAAAPTTDEPVVSVSRNSADDSLIFTPLRDNEPKATGRHCPLDNDTNED